MSNFIKYNYVQQKPQTKARVINSNPRMEEVMRGLNGAQKFEAQSFDAAEADEDGFEAGLEADVVEQVPQIDPQELIAQAQQEADRILQEAQARADQILEDANAQAQNLFEQQRDAGYSAGQEEAQNFLQEQQSGLEAQLQQQSEALAAQYQEREATMEAEIVDALAQVIEQTFGIFVEDKKEVLIFLIQKTLLGIENGKNFKIRVSPENAKYVNDKVPEIREEFGTDMVIEVQHDASLDEESCIIETEYGIYHCGMDVQLKNLLMQMRALSQ